MKSINAVLPLCRIIPLPKAAAQHAKLARHAESTATNPNPLKRKAGAAGEANNTFSSSIARLVVAAIEGKSWRVLKWLVTCMHAQVRARVDPQAYKFGDWISSDPTSKLP